MVSVSMVQIKGVMVVVVMVGGDGEGGVGRSDENGMIDSETFIFSVQYITGCSEY